MKRLYVGRVLIIMLIGSISLSVTFSFLGYFQGIRVSDDQSLTIGEFETKPNEPVLFTNMNPVYWDDLNNEIVKYTDVETLTLNPFWDESLWYDYVDTSQIGMENQSKWANAKTLDGSYWVWIPRFVYTISTLNWHTSIEGTVDVRFVQGTNDQTAYRQLASTGTANDSNGTWTSHPAFTFNSNELTGFWFAKFEASNQALNEPEFVPGVIPWHDDYYFDTIFFASRDMENNSVKYGWLNSEIDTHLVKNNEWGAMAYLSYSKFGTNGEQIERNTVVMTGGSETNWENNVLQSSTFNVYGIFDLIGSAQEYVTAYSEAATFQYNTDECKILGEPYCDAISADLEDTIFNKGDAVYETSLEGAYGSWFGKKAWLPYSGAGLMIRSGKYSDSNWSLFAYDRVTGNIRAYTSFRVTLIAKDS